MVFLSPEVVRVGRWEEEELGLVLLVMVEMASNQLHQLLNQHHCFHQVVLESEYREVPLYSL